MRQKNGNPEEPAALAAGSFFGCAGHGPESRCMPVRQALLTPFDAPGRRIAFGTGFVKARGVFLAEYPVITEKTYG